MKFAPYSYSRISSFQTCARKFKYTYIDKADKKPQNMEPLLKGGAVHHILENHPWPSTHKLAPQYQHIVDKFLRTEHGKKLMFRESTREFDFGLDKDLVPCGYNDEHAIFRGSVDYIFIENGVLYLVDWKTGKYKEQRWQTYDQLMFYGLYFFIRYPNVNKIHISYVYIEHENLHNDLTLERKWLDDYKEKLLNAINEIETEEVFPKTVKNQKLCDWCEFQLHCEQDV